MPKSKQRKQPRPAPSPTNTKASIHRMSQDAEYLARVWNDFFSLDSVDNGVATAMIDNIAVYLSLFVHETIHNSSLQRITPQGTIRARVHSKELQQSRHVIKFIENNNKDTPIMGEYEAISSMGLSELEKASGERGVIVFYDKCLINTLHNMRVMLGLRSDCSNPYPYQEALQYLTEYFALHGTPSTNIEPSGKTLNNIAWNAVHEYSKWQGPLYKKAFKGISDEASSAMLASCQALINFIEKVLGRSSDPRDAEPIFRIKYITYHAVLMTLKNEKSLLKVDDECHLNEVIGCATFETSSSMRNELVHYNTSAHFSQHIDFKKPLLGMTDYFHNGASFESVSTNLDYSFSKLASALSKWGIQEKHAGIPFVSHHFGMIARKEYSDRKQLLIKRETEL